MTLTLTANEPAARLGWWNITGGIVLPLLCAAAQVVLLREDILGPWLVWGYAVFGIAAVLASARSALSPSARSFVCGANFGCAAGWLVTAFDHYVFSYYFVWPFAIVTILPFSCAAAQVNAQRGRLLWAQIGGLRLNRLVALGALAALLPPAAAQVAETRWVEANMAHFWSGDTPAAAANAVRAFNRYPLRFGRFATDVCEQVVIDRSDVWSDDEELVRQLEIMLGPDFWHCEPRDPHG